jgi:tetratricopeptide (TPR) repeat protein
MQAPASPAVEAPASVAAAEPPATDAVVQPAPSGLGGQAASGEQVKPEEQAKVEEEFAKRMDEGAEAFAIGDFDKARHAFVLAILSIPESVDAKLAYAITQFAMGDYHVAAILLRQVIPAHPEVVYSDFDLRGRYNNKEKLAQQTEALRAYVKAHPKDVEPMLVLGFVQHFSDQRDQARKTFTEALKVSPKESVASIFLKPPAMQAPSTQAASQGTAAAPVNAPTTQPAAAGQLPIGGK